VDFRGSLEYLYGLQRFGIKLGLENIREILRRLGYPDRRFPLIHVAGTNGKGSVCAALSEILTEAGFRAGLYTSPHLHSFNERIRVNGAPIAEKDVARLTEKIRLLSEGIPATFFEFTTAMALKYFEEERVDCAVLEVGMGGRLDATNAVLPVVCAISPICFDHTAHLGSDIASIAEEKSGIIKEKVPVVVGPQEPKALEVIEAAARRCDAPLYLFGRDYEVESAGERFTFRFPSQEVLFEGLQPGLLGLHQHANLATALAVAVVFGNRGFTLPDGALRCGVEKVRWPGRLEWWGGGRDILLDGAHNAGGAAVLADYLSTLTVKGVRWVAGMKGDKNAADILFPILPFVSALYCTTPPVEESVSADDLARTARGAGVAAEVFVTPDEALEAAMQDRREGEIVLVAGSLFLVAAAREYLAGINTA